MDVNNDFRFYNSTRKNMKLTDVIEEIKDFIKRQPDDIYRIAIGTDSQRIGNKMIFVTAIYVHRLGKGAWFCISKTQRNLFPELREKIMAETKQTQEICNFFEAKAMQEIKKIVKPYVKQGAWVYFEAHIDVGENGDTRALIWEAVSHFDGIKVNVKIKPKSPAASTVANKYSKNCANL